jgi:tRNA-Thr(GGU) m(6)t(6)A37 methyltransferase TsaA
MTATLRYIGEIRTPFQTLAECPRNVDPEGPPCELRVRPDFVDGLAGLNAGDYVLVLYWLQHADRGPLVQRRRDGGEEKGVFALRSPHRPNPIGAAVVKAERITGGRIEVRGMDCLDRTPLLDIKPAIFSPQPGGDAPGTAG